MTDYLRLLGFVLPAPKPESTYKINSAGVFLPKSYAEERGTFSGMWQTSTYQNMYTMLNQSLINKSSFYSMMYEDFDESPKVLKERASTDVIVGWRAWGKTSDGRLRSIATGNTTWQPRHAPPAIHKGRKPLARCTCPNCGYYAMKTIGQLVRDCTEQNFNFVGEVALWGRVVVHEHGYRAEYAYPKTIYANVDDTMRAKLANNYGVEVYKMGHFWRRYGEWLDNNK